ncbi:hypothetical protein PPSIR1_20074 [Plesiocystis pacifica SIR-1]|uniref:Lipoprotein n=2 Tax=Plesiocystis pacifica TaxID=191768 RepID=A6GGY0_9BACT|nr:hypothetical protein PPSIR1_20074 [Plesiocystis pacifica SIR-1]
MSRLIMFQFDLEKIAPPLSLTLGLLLAGCAGDTKPPDSGNFDDEASAGANDSGLPLPIDVGVGELDPGECIAGEKNGEDGAAWGYVHQCGGVWWGRIGFTFEGTGLDLYVPSADGWAHFGQGHEDYLESKVMACCGPHDPQLPLADQPTYAENCMLDLRQQVCMSISAGLESAIESGDIPKLKETVDLQNWIADNTTACMKGLEDTNDSPTGLKAKWEIPPAGTPWDESDFDIQDVYVEVILANLSDLYRPPAIEGAPICDSLNWNRDHLFERGLPPSGPGIDAVLESGAGMMLGPVIDPESGTPLQLGTTFASLDTSCTGLDCSRLSLSADASTNTWSLDELRLIPEPRLTAEVAGQTIVVEQSRIELYGDAKGQLGMAGGVSEYRLAAGDAQFVVRAEVAGEMVMLFAHSSTDLVAVSDSAGGWELQPFELVYTDAQGDAWTMTVSATQWL